MAVYRRGEAWVADFWIGGREGRRVRKSAPTRKLAEALEREHKAREFRGELSREIKPVTLSKLIEVFEELREVAETTRECNALVFQHLKAFFGNPLVQTVLPSDIERYRAQRLKVVKPVTVNIELRVLRSLLNRAVEWGYLRQAPLVRLLKVETISRRFLTLEEGARLIEAATGQMRTFIVLGLNTGLRKGELFRLAWGDIDFERGELTVRKAKSKRFRIVPLNTTASQALRQHPRHIRSSLVFHNPDGSAWKDVRGGFNSALTRARLPRIRIHDMRHSFISNLVSAGVDVRVTQELAGHASIATTMLYAHLAPGRLRASVAALEE